MEMERKFGFDRAILEDKIIEDSDQFLVMPAVIAREIVQPYPEGKAYKPADELEKAAWTAESRWVATMNHPETGLLQRRSDIKGRVENAKFVKDIMDPKTKRPMVRGIRADIRWYKNMVPMDLINSIKSGSIRDVSIGFTYDEDKTPGEWDGEKYDFIQRNIFIDHVVAPCEIGRCPSPFCGIAVDVVLKDKSTTMTTTTATKIAGDPWEETEEFIRSGHRSPNDFDPSSLRTIQITEGIKAIVGCPKGKFEDGKCTVGTEVQSFLFDKKKFTMAQAKEWFEKHEDMKEKDIVEVDKLSVSQIQAKIEELYGKIDILREKEQKYYTNKNVGSDPELEKIWREIEDMDLEIKAYKELKVKTIVEESDCPICAEIDRLGKLKFAKKLVELFGEDVKKVYSKEHGQELEGKDTATKEENKAKKQGQVGEEAKPETKDDIFVETGKVLEIYSRLKEKSAVF